MHQLFLHAHFQLLCQHVLQHPLSHQHLRGPLPGHRPGGGLTEVEEPQRGQSGVHLHLAVCYHRDLLVPHDGPQALGLLPFQALRADRVRVLPADGDHRSVYRQDHERPFQPGPYAAEPRQTHESRAAAVNCAGDLHRLLHTISRPSSSGLLPSRSAASRDRVPRDCHPQQPEQLLGSCGVLFRHYKLSVDHEEFFQEDRKRTDKWGNYQHAEKLERIRNCDCYC